MTHIRVCYDPSPYEQVEIHVRANTWRARLILWLIRPLMGPYCPPPPSAGAAKEG